MEFSIVYLYILIITICSKRLQVQGDTNNGLEKPLNIEKRHLNWNKNGYIKSTDGSRLEVMYLQPHPKNVPVKSDGDYLAFTLYMRNGLAVAPYTGIFHFIDSSIANRKKEKCGRASMHAGAYYHFYDKCPEEEFSIVASGYCYQGSSGRGLVYKSITFNSVSNVANYADKKYYSNDNETVNPYEQNLIKACFNKWKVSKFKVKSWKCSTRDVSFASGLTSNLGKRSKRASTVCNDCECTPVNGSSGVKYFGVLIVFMSLLGVQIMMH